MSFTRIPKQSPKCVSRKFFHHKKVIIPFGEYYAACCTVPTSSTNMIHFDATKRSQISNKLTLDLPIDERVKQEIWRKLLDFAQSDENDCGNTMTFPQSLSNTERRYIHTACMRLNLKSKSVGIKGINRTLIVEKRKQKTPEHDVVQLTDRQRSIIDHYLAKHNVDYQKYAQKKYMKSQIQRSSRLTSKKLRSKREEHENEQYYQSFMERKSRSDSCAVHIRKHRESLSVFSRRKDILDAIEANQIIIIDSSTGSGKSTQIPQYILEQADEQHRGACISMLVTEPRRVAATTLADRVAEELGQQVGMDVGYQIRLESVRSTKTRLTYATVGVVLKMLATNPMLEGITHVIVDEAHERDKLVDFLLIILKDLLHQRLDLKLLIMSATLNVDVFRDYFPRSSMLHLEGQHHKVHTLFLADILELTSYNPDLISSADHSNRSKQQYTQKSQKLQSFLEEITSISSINCKTSVYNDNGAFEISPTDALFKLSRGQLDFDVANQEWLELLIDEECSDGSSLERPLNLPDNVNVFGWKDTFEYNTDVVCPVWDDDRQEFVAHGSDIRASLGNHVENSGHLSAETNRTLERMEQEGFEFIDYALICHTIQFICQHFGAECMHQINGNHDINDEALRTGAILVFVPGWDDISELIMRLKDMLDTRNYIILPLHGQLSPEEQRLVFKPAPYGKRKVVISTNVAESSVTISDVVFVIDTGKLKEKTYDPVTKLSTLATKWIAKANANQRAGRAGRLRSGLCFRLYTKQQFDMMDIFQTPEILRVPLEELCLQIKTLCLGNISQFLSKSMQPPDSKSISNAIWQLQQIGALDSDENITVLGAHLAALPTDPRIGKMLLMGVLLGCIDPILTIAGCLSYRDPFTISAMTDRVASTRSKQKFSRNSNSDFLTLLNAYNEWLSIMNSRNPGSIFDWCRSNFISHTSMLMIRDVRSQLARILVQLGFQMQSFYSSNISLVQLVTGACMYPFVARIAVQNSKKVVTMLLREGLKGVVFHPSSVNCGLRGNEHLPSSYVVYNEAVRGGSIFLRTTSFVQPEALLLLCGVPATATAHWDQLADDLKSKARSMKIEKINPKSALKMDKDERKDAAGSCEDDEDGDSKPLTKGLLIALDEWLVFRVCAEDRKRLLALRTHWDAFISSSLSKTIQNVDRFIADVAPVDLNPFVSSHSSHRQLVFLLIELVQNQTQTSVLTA